MTKQDLQMLLQALRLIRLTARDRELLLNQLCFIIRRKDSGFDEELFRKQSTPQRHIGDPTP